MQELPPAFSSVDISLSMPEKGCSTSSSCTVPSQGDQCLCRQKGNPQMKVDFTSYQQLVLTYPWFNCNTRMGENPIKETTSWLLLLLSYTPWTTIFRFIFIFTHTYALKGVISLYHPSFWNGDTTSTTRGTGRQWGCRVLPQTLTSGTVFSMYPPSAPAQRAKLPCCPHTDVLKRTHPVALTAANQVVEVFLCLKMKEISEVEGRCRVFPRRSQHKITAQSWIKIPSLPELKPDLSFLTCEVKKGKYTVAKKLEKQKGITF